jgi:hypothetical protein
MLAADYLVYRGLKSNREKKEDLVGRAPCPSFLMDRLEAYPTILFTLRSCPLRAQNFRELL